MNLSFSYILRNLWTRKLTTLLTAMGMALVVFVFATVLMLSEGLEKTLVATGSPDNVIVIRRSAETEVQSVIDREQATIIVSLSNPASGPAGKPLVSKELMVLMVLTKKDSGKPANVTVRGISDTGLVLRPQVHLTQGRMFRPGAREIIVGNKIVQGFTGIGIGEKLHLGLGEWTVTGIFDAGKTGFGSEIWGDVNQLMQAFRRNAYSSVIFKLADPTNFEQTQSRIENDQRLTVEAKRESQFYAEQSEMMSRFLEILGLSLSAIFSIGAVIGAMITMYASVANRTAEIGTLRAIGFPQQSILQAFLLESLALSLTGGVVGLAIASLMQLLTISTMNWQTFSELAFSFTLTKAIAWQSVLFSLVMGLVGGFLPAIRAARMNIVDALRAA
ncbi:ABC transporter permease [Nitrosococcus wardiae]|uniref:ABC transporter permease n=1 Tax=Nitrosococcus wardiae TaxID=1814290 RepID=A0A4P7C2Y9_9GAMM|nr:ABC transporter permease [Nitrosococcus wardiae]QBQ56070.1 ABC transporter permease [Nitrosococcus wardiae]